MMVMIHTVMEMVIMLIFDDVLDEGDNFDVDGHVWVKGHMVLMIAHMLKVITLMIAHMLKVIMLMIMLTWS